MDDQAEDPVAGRAAPGRQLDAGHAAVLDGPRAPERGTVRTRRAARPDRVDHRTEEGVVSEREPDQERDGVGRRSFLTGALLGAGLTGVAAAGIAGGVAYAGDDVPVGQSDADARLAALTGDAPARPITGPHQTAILTATQR